MYCILFKRFSTMLDKGLRKNIKKKKKRWNGETGKQTK